MREHSGKQVPVHLTSIAGGGRRFQAKLRRSRKRACIEAVFRGEQLLPSELSSPALLDTPALIRRVSCFWVVDPLVICRSHRLADQARRPGASTRYRRL